VSVHLLNSERFTVACDSLFSPQLVAVLFSEQFDWQPDVGRCERLWIRASSCLRVAAICLVLKECFGRHASLRPPVLMRYLLQLKNFLSNLVCYWKYEVIA